ncbi:MAG: PEP-CTERM sorting domain-containing protein [Alteromonadaceae bacterium]|nr:MAG: PEP-CTERM sorting domain-containing protein [Alteromonadaceae bacterium]
MMNKLLTAALLSVVSASVSATTITYTDFSDLSNIQLNGATAGINPTGDNSLRLTNSLSQSGSAFLKDSISLDNQASFSAAFDFRITNPQGISDSDGQGADGIVFTVQSVSNTAGGSGGGIGYQGLTKSVGVEFDTWDNGSWDENDGNHVGINIDGNINSVVQASVAPRMNNGAVWSAWVDYNGVTDLLEVRISDNGIRSADAYISYIVDLENVIDSSDVFIGFTSGTGAAGGYHDILNFEFHDDYNPIDVPAPGTLALFGLGLTGLGFSRRKNKS